MRMFIVMVLMALWMGTARAGESEAATRYSAGSKAFEDGDFQRAVDELKASVALKPTVKAYLTLGNAYLKLGQIDEARASFERILEIDPHTSKRKTVEGLIHDLDVLARTKLVVTSVPPGANVYIDLKAEGSRGKTPVTIPVLPGRHQVMLELDGYKPATIPEATAVEGQEVPVGVTLEQRGCDLSITAVPAGAGVRVDAAQPTGVPVTVRVSLGDHQLTFYGAGLETKTRTVSCQEAPLAVSETLGPSAASIEEARVRAEQARQRAEEARVRAEEERVRAEQERQRIERERRDAIARAERQRAARARLRYAGYAMAGVTVLSAVVAGGMAGAGSAVNDHVRKGGFSSESALTDQLAAGQNYNRAGIAMAVLASAAAVVAVPLIVIGSRKEAPRVSFGPGGVSLAGSF
jgi:hypothetical protein